MGVEVGYASKHVNERRSLAPARVHARKQARDKNELESIHGRQHHKKIERPPQHHQHVSHKGDSDTQNRAPNSKDALAASKHVSASVTAAEPIQKSPLSLPQQSIPLPPPTPSSTNLYVPIAAATQAQHSMALPKTVDRPKPSIAVIAGATLGGIVLFLVLLMVSAYKCSNRKTAVRKGNAATFSRDATYPATTSTRKIKTMQEEANVAFPMCDQSSQAVHQRTSTDFPRDCLQSSQKKQQAGSAMLQRSPTVVPINPINPINLRSHEFIGIPMDQDARGQNLGPNRSSYSHGGEDMNTDPPELDQSLSHQDEEKTDEGGDDCEIDRCLSYYMKRRTRFSEPSGLIQDLPSPLAQHLNNLTTEFEMKDRASRSSLKFAKTSKLLEKIRRSQIRLNNEALLNARREGYRASKSIHSADRTDVPESQSYTSSPISVATETSRCDNSEAFTSVKTQGKAGKKIPAHWRSSSKLHRYRDEFGSHNEQAMSDSSPGVSESHSAFEYADYYDSYLPGPHTSVSLQVQDGFACRSWALSPRRSENRSARQRSATFSQGSSPAWPQSANLDVAGDLAAMRRTRSHLSSASDIQRQSAEFDDVIRF
ncbi:uncharacterized protein MEPE_02224 [Melanopsichium pennsylvanicum]|uniref:Uncharacterized protein n=2 Tax=Melanopsichium pennsylvanicum TaxID=63383 RepID=A0AAJ4XKA0_9BASI|nr:putative protein [Melanopsichium pennsylvanicum 4]SNX83517.1 uncharacterized protein MEPE_02224 [Melanopsichium pennsylvanicum]